MKTEKQKIEKPSGDTSGIIMFGVSVIFIVFGLLGGWMAYAPLSASSVAIGQVSADMDKKTIQHLEGGIVENIFVKDGDNVKKGETLLKLKDVQIKAQLNILEAQYQDAQALYDRLNSHAQRLDKIVFSEFLNNQNIIDNQRYIFETIIKTQLDEKLILKKRKRQLTNQINGLKSLIKSKKTRLVSIKDEIIDWDKLYKQRLVDKQRIRDLKREENTIIGDIASTKSEVSKIKEQISEIETTQLLREKEFDKDVLNSLVEVKSKLADLKLRIIATKDTLNRTTIIAPIDGTVVGLNLHTVGGVIAPGSKILDIIPEDSDLIVVAQVVTTDIDKVKVGLKADIMFSAFNLRQTHFIEGEVIHVSADSFMDEATKQPYYEAKVIVTPEGEKYLKQYGFELVAGMPATVMIKLGERTALSYLVKPFTDMIVRGFNEE